MLELFLEVALLSIPVFTGVSSDQSGIVTKTEYVQYIPGDTNLIISIPHDGRRRPSDLRDRTNGTKASGECDYRADASNVKRKHLCKVTVHADWNTKKIGLLMSEEFKRITGKSPYMVIANLHRSKVDFNRDIYTAAQLDKNSEIVYKDYHDTLAEVRRSLKGPGLLIDLHGQSHKHGSTELGYLWKIEDLNSANYTRRPSVRALMKRQKLKPDDIISGPLSMGALFENEGYKAIPSPRQPKPGSGGYFRGGFITQTYGSDKGGVVDAIQIEVPKVIRFAEDPIIEKFSKSLANILRTFYERNY